MESRVSAALESVPHSLQVGQPVRMRLQSLIKTTKQLSVDFSGGLWGFICFVGLSLKTPPAPASLSSDFSWAHMAPQPQHAESAPRTAARGFD